MRYGNGGIITDNLWVIQRYCLGWLGLLSF